MPNRSRAPALQHAFQAAAERDALNFFGVARADGVDGVGEHEAGLQQVELAVELHLVPVEVSPIEAGQQHVPMPEAALVGKVVDGNQRDRVFEPRDAAVFDLQQSGDETGLPVVAVDDIDIEVQEPDGFEDRTTEEHKTLAVVAIIFAALLIQAVAVEVVVLANEVDGDFWPGGSTRLGREGEESFEQLARDGLLADRDGKLNAGRSEVEAALKDGPIGGQE